MSKVNDYRDDDVETLYDRLLPLMQADEPDVYGRKVRAQEAIRAALEAVSSIHEAEPVGDDEDRLQEIADGAWGDNPMVRGKARDMLASRHPTSIPKVETKGAHVSSLWQNKIDDMSRAYGILEAQHREQRQRAQKLDDNLSLAIEVLLNYADPSGYVDRDGNLPEHDEGALARETLAKIAPHDARVKSCLSHTAGEIEAGGEVTVEPVKKMHELTEQAFRDGVAYATNCEVTDVDLAWSQSRVRAAVVKP